MAYVTLIYEDEPMRAVMEALLQRRPEMPELRLINCRGCSRIKKNIQAYCKSAHGSNFYFVMTDLDRNPCAPALVQEWLGGLSHPNFLFRVAVHEVESWLLADRENFADFFKVPLSKIPLNPDSEENPKEIIFELARKSKNAMIRKEVPPVKLAHAGVSYVSIVTQFIETQWSVLNAAENSPSLKKALQRVLEWDI
ncbi:MAG: DUF4276 family protein [Thermoguttaceae bacterium]|nr:DUF4276 family protein [Thermoguttaceae bacterium]